MKEKIKKASELNKKKRDEVEKLKKFTAEMLREPNLGLVVAQHFRGCVEEAKELMEPNLGLSHVILVWPIKTKETRKKKKKKKMSARNPEDCEEGSGELSFRGS